jgi:hypothetical protein
MAVEKKDERASSVVYVLGIGFDEKTPLPLFIETYVADNKATA